MPTSRSHSLTKFIVSSDVGESERAASRIVPSGDPSGMVRNPSGPTV